MDFSQKKSSQWPAKNIPNKIHNPSFSGPILPKTASLWCDSVTEHTSRHLRSHTVETFDIFRRKRFCSLRKKRGVQSNNCISDRICWWMDRYGWDVLKVNKKKLDEVYSIHRRQIEIRNGATICPHRGKLLLKCRSYTLP